MILNAGEWGIAYQKYCGSPHGKLWYLIYLPTLYMQIMLLGSFHPPTPTPISPILTLRTKSSLLSLELLQFSPFPLLLNLLKQLLFGGLGLDYYSSQLNELPASSLVSLQILAYTKTIIQKWKSDQVIPLPKILWRLLSGLGVKSKLLGMAYKVIMIWSQLSHPTSALTTTSTPPRPHSFYSLAMLHYLLASRSLHRGYFLYLNVPFPSSPG